MLLKISDLNGLAIEARDGRIGSVQDVLFDDESWQVRWLVVDTGSWLSGRRVLLPASHLGRLDHRASAIPVDLAMRQVEESPGSDSELPVSRQMETAIYGHYAWTPYWPIGPGSVYPAPLAGGAGAWGAAGAMPMVAPEAASSGGDPAGDPHLRSAREVTGYAIAGTDEDVGHVEDLVLDSEAWALRYVVVDTRNWWPGRKVMVPREAVVDILWGERTVRLDRTREEIKRAPELATA